MTDWSKFSLIQSNPIYHLGKCRWNKQPQLIEMKIISPIIADHHSDGAGNGFKALTCWGLLGMYGSMVETWNMTS